MKRWFGNCLGRTGGSLLVVLCVVFLPMFAQKKNIPERVHALPPGGPPPRVADGHPDFSGVWFPNGAGIDLEFVAPDDAFNGTPTADLEARRQFDPKVTPEEKPPFQPWAAAKIKAMSPAERELVQLMELNNNFRVVHTDGRSHAKDPDPGFYGDEVAHWEGDTLVIDSIALDENTWNDLNAWFHSDQEHVIGRLTRPSMNYLVYQVTIEDPKVLTKSWTSAPRRW